MKNMLRKMTCVAGLAMGVCVGSNYAEPVREQAEWTILTFVNADNNLDRYGVIDMNEAAKVGSTKDVNIVFQLDRAYGKPCNRYFVEKGNPKIVEEMGEVDMGDVNVMVDFLKWGVENYPAKRYALVVWNHGSGWDKNKVSAEYKGISYDDQSGNHITTAQLTTGMADIKDYLGRNLDILAFDACLMQMVEVAYAVKDGVDVMVASEETEPGNGWCYESAMGPLVANPAISAEELGDILVKGYDASYDGGTQGNSATTQAWVRPALTPEVVAALDAFSVAAVGNYAAEIKDILYRVQKFYIRSNIDLKHFMVLVKEKIADEEVVAAADAVIAAVDKFVGLSLTNQSKMANASGTAIYFPSAGYSFQNKYLDLDFAKDSLWDEFLKAYYEVSKTRESDL
jgi:hypothetical protein